MSRAGPVHRPVGRDGGVPHVEGGAGGRPRLRQGRPSGAVDDGRDVHLVPPSLDPEPARHGVRGPVLHVVGVVGVLGGHGVLEPSVERVEPVAGLALETAGRARVARRERQLERSAEDRRGRGRGTRRHAEEGQEVAPVLRSADEPSPGDVSHHVGDGGERLAPVGVLEGLERPDAERARGGTRRGRGRLVHPQEIRPLVELKQAAEAVRAELHV